MQLPLHGDPKSEESGYEKQPITVINNIFEKIMGICPESFHTEPARCIAGKRQAIVHEYLQRFLDEWSGNDLSTIDR
jgi:hypothetical protein